MSSSHLERQWFDQQRQLSPSSIVLGNSFNSSSADYKSEERATNYQAWSSPTPDVKKTNFTSESRSELTSSSLAKQKNNEEVSGNDSRRFVFLAYDAELSDLIHSLKLQLVGQRAIPASIAHTESRPFLTK